MMVRRDVTLCHLRSIDGQQHRLCIAQPAWWYERERELERQGERVWLNIPPRVHVHFTGHVASVALLCERFTVEETIGRYLIFEKFCFSIYLYPSVS